MTPTPPPPIRLGITHWLILTIASIGFAFDIYELLIMPLILRDALRELTGAQPGSALFGQWAGTLFYVPFLIGGVVGLYGGFLTDQLGRRRVLTGSILLYAFSAFFAGFSTTPWMLLFFRTTTIIGVCVEFVAAIAWLAELFPNPRQRESVLGYTQAFSSIGGLLVAVAYSFINEIAASLPAIGLPGFLGFLGEIRDPHAVWRYTLMSGLVPAIPLVLIRPFLPESPVWAKKKAEGSLKRPSVVELFDPKLRRTTVVTTLMFACSYGVAFGAIQQIPQIVPGLAEVRAKTDSMSKPEKMAVERKSAADHTKVQEIGGLVGRFLLAVLAVRIVGRRLLLRLFQIPALFVVPAVFFFFLTVENRRFAEIDLSAVRLGSLPITTVSLGVFVAGLFTVAQFSFWGNYLPRVYPVHLRGTGESFAANIGGRVFGTSFAAVTSLLAAQEFIPGATSPEKYAFTAGAVALAVTLVGSIACFFLPEPTGEHD